MFIVLMFAVCGVAFMVTGHGGKVSGRKLVLIAFAISCVASVLLLCASLVVQINYSHRYAAPFNTVVQTV